VASFPHISPQNPLYTSYIHHTCYMVRPSHSVRFDHSNNIWWRVQATSRLPCYLVPLKPKYTSQHPILKHLNPTFLHQ
jgi:hypothetical protein